MAPPSSSSPAATGGPSTRGTTPTPASAGDEKPELPWAFIDCSTDKLIILISHMLNLLIQHNDQVVLTPDALTRFHSRAAPGISVIEYLRRIVKYTNMEKIPLLSLLAYIDITCQHLPSFTLSSLTVHRFLIAGVCAGSKAQCDVFCTNGHYAKVGGIKVQELNSLERELLRVTQWALCCNADLLQRYYTSLIKSHGGYTQAAAPSTIPYRPFPRSSSKPRPVDSPSRAVSTPPSSYPIEEDPTSPPAVGVEATTRGEDAEMEAEPAQAEFVNPVLASTSDIPSAASADAEGSQEQGQEMDVDPPDRPPETGANAGLQYSPHSEASSSIPSSSNSPRSSRTRLTSLQSKQLREGQPAPPHLEKHTATQQGSPDIPSGSNRNATNGARAYEKDIGNEEEMLAAPPPPQITVPPPPSQHSSTSRPNPPITQPAASTSTAQSQTHTQHHHHHHLHAPSGKALKNLVGGIFHRKTSGDHPPNPPPAAAPTHPASSSASRPPQSEPPSAEDREPPLEHTDLHNGLEQSSPAQPTHPTGEGQPWQPSSMISASGNGSPRLTARIPRSPRVGGPSPRMQSTTVGGGGGSGGSGGRPEAATPVTPKIRTRDERSTESMRDADRISGLNSAAIGAVGGEEGKRRAV